MATGFLGFGVVDDEPVPAAVPLGTSPLDYLSCVAATVRVHGWVSKAEAARTGNRPTAELADALYLGLTGAVPSSHPRFTVTDEDRTVAQDAYALAINGYHARTASDFDTRQRGALLLPRHNVKLSPFVAPAINRYQRTVAADARRESQAAVSQHVGVAGERLTRSLTVTSARTFDGHWGPTTAIGFVDAEGNVYTWFASNPDDGYVVGSTHQVTGTVKDHGSYRGVAQTVLTRCTRPPTAEELAVQAEARRRQQPLTADDEADATARLLALPGVSRVAARREHGQSHLSFDRRGWTAQYAVRTVGELEACELAINAGQAWGGEDIAARDARIRAAELAKRLSPDRASLAAAQVGGIVKTYTHWIRHFDTEYPGECGTVVKDGIQYDTLAELEPLGIDVDAVLTATPLGGLPRPAGEVRLVA